MPEQGGSRGQPGPSKEKGREGGQSGKKEPSEGTSEKAGQERPRSCGEPIIVPPGGEGGSRQNILLGAELTSYDEVKVWTEEGEEESEMTCSERLQAELQDDPGGGPPLIPIDPPDPPPSPREQDLTGKSEPSGSPYTPPGFLGFPYPGYPPPPHIGRGGSPLSPFLYPDHLGSPPPAHMGSLPYNLDPNKGPVGFRTYPFTSQYGGYPGFPPDLTTWSEGMFPYGSLRHGVPPFLPGRSLASAISRFSASGLFSGGGFGSPPLSPPHGMGGISLINQVKLEPGLDDKKGKKKPHIKKPLNAFMLYMKEMRPQVVAECTLKESAAINQILGRKWHALTREEQAKYYEQARKERQLHMQMYPGWSARDNYAQTKEPKKKRKREKTQDTGGNPLKKCRARWGLEQTDLWCKPCKRKKKCVREGGEDIDSDSSTEDLCYSHSLPSISSPRTADHGFSYSAPPTPLPHRTPPLPISLSPHPLTINPFLRSPARSNSPYAVSHPIAIPSARSPIGCDPRDENNPLSVSQLTSSPKQNSDNRDKNQIML